MDFKSMKIKEINDFFKGLHVEEKIKYVDSLKLDERSGVKKVLEKIEKEHKKYLMEIKRVKDLWKIENLLNVDIIGGIDEAGRGPLAGPVVAACVVLPKNIFIEGINDSKKISPKKRDELFEIISKNALDIGIGIVDNEVIDNVNIFNATKIAMLRAINSLKKSPDYLLIDAVTLDDINIRQEAVIKGDSKSASIAAASIVAKVTRDRIIDRYDKEYPEYGFKNHKGYGTKEHYEAIKKHGITPIHRRSFLKNILEAN
ncbi:MAG: ribonuclease HII [Anaeromicrobium sp.]|jgi:ribonuclease HII|uniref:ribonuclease HII n=1 Tax=Anaeromicrobium sp. TaxID=1929132 RepID=UPI0025DD3833|nr:ribonuclease HII [Anaeromicrobium sp.]MCT4594961.1 ribonuclease HII [Anaeromicrobium sp.]